MSNGWWIATLILLALGIAAYWRGRHGWGTLLIVLALAAIAGTPGNLGLFVRAAGGTAPIGLSAAWDHITATMGW